MNRRMFFERTVAALALAVFGGSRLGKVRYQFPRVYYTRVGNVVTAYMTVTLHARDLPYDLGAPADYDEGELTLPEWRVS